MNDNLKRIIEQGTGLTKEFVVSALWPSRSESFAKVAAELVKAQGEFEHAAKDSENPHFKSKYADLAGIIDTFRGIFAKHSLSVIQPTLKADGQGVHIQTIILHSSGEWIADQGFYLPATRFDAQGCGSALTYARRYALASLLGIAQDDDDANTASEKPAAKTRAARPKEPTVKLAPVAAKKKLGERISELPDELKKQVENECKKSGIVWTQLTAPQLNVVSTWVDACDKAVEDSLKTQHVADEDIPFGEDSTDEAVMIPSDESARETTPASEPVSVPV